MNAGITVRVIGVVVAALLILPTIIICATAFTSGTQVTFPPDGFSTRWIDEILGDRRWMRAFGNSFAVGLLAAAFAMIAGGALALGAARARGAISTVFTAVSVLPMILPLVVGAVGFYLVYVRVGLTGNVLGLALAHGVLGLPYVFVNVLALLRTLDARVEEAARVHGAGQFMTLVTITLPLVAPATVVGGLLAFISSWDEVVVATFLSDARFQTLPVLMYTQIRSGVEPSVSAVALIVTVVTFAIALIVSLVGPIRARLARRGQRTPRSS
ncbi:ABC transporter permease [Microbacterium sp. cf332]|uniref:ABC transporter permease n=1 Tax=Microbacterium sp. cf332 TaxID=1761804 RepID=UPI00088E1572|nr:ABC transporter permease [Microbacterium sp. cf332]SDQ57984.1 putative spermidine/putrescine transport system permease protein [Microbacterium sp. cf332]